MGTEMEGAVKLASIEEQLSHLTKTTDEIKEALSSFKNMDVRMAEIAVRFETTRNEMGTMWKKLDSVKDWTEHHEKDSAETRRNLDSAITAVKAEATAAITTVKAEVESVVNKGRGAWWILGGVLGLSQVITIGVAAWLFNNVNDSTRINAVQQYRIERLESASKVWHSEQQPSALP